MLTCKKSNLLESLHTRQSCSFFGRGTQAQGGLEGRTGAKAGHTSVHSDRGPRAVRISNAVLGFTSAPYLKCGRGNEPASQRGATTGWQSEACSISSNANCCAMCTCGGHADGDYLHRGTHGHHRAPCSQPTQHILRHRALSLRLGVRQRTSSDGTCSLLDDQLGAAQNAVSRAGAASTKVAAATGCGCSFAR